MLWLFATATDVVAAIDVVATTDVVAAVGDPSILIPCICMYLYGCVLLCCCYFAAFLPHVMPFHPKLFYYCCCCITDNALLACCYYKCLL